MSKRNSDGDVLSNRVSLGLANSQKRLAALLGRVPESHATSIVNQEADEEEEDFTKEYVDPEQCVYYIIVTATAHSTHTYTQAWPWRHTPQRHRRWQLY